jgi:thiamine-phosphate pyrophosphorylase
MSAVSTSFHTLADLGACRGELGYCFLSPIYLSISKPGYKAAFPDPDELAAGLAASRCPVLALGGVTPDKFGGLAGLGFAGAALLGAIWQAADPLAAWQEAQAAAAAVTKRAR